ncbi:MAG: TonB-dependent receptor, partial [Pseudomonadota bacterium]|nr:TonB-dependent receptor [Pseudomonadota bacterium]
MPAGLALGGVGEDDYGRLVVADTPKLGAGHLLYGLEVVHNDGPWSNPDNFRKINAVLRYSQGSAQNGFNVTALGYTSKGTATNQIATRAVVSGLIGRFDTLDASDGSDSERYSLAADWRPSWSAGVTRANAYVIRNELNLYSNFTYLLDDPVNGDQFEQFDDRNVYGWTGSWSKAGELFGAPTRNTLGFDLRQDRIKPVGLYSTIRRERLTTTREDNVIEGSAGLYAQNDTQWNDWFRSILGLRYDRYRFKVDASVAENSGNVTSG